MTEPILITNDTSAILAGSVATYEALTGRTLAAGQVERLLIGAMAYRESIIRAQFQAAALQSYVDFATGPGLEYLAVLVGVSRLASSESSCTIGMTFLAGHSGVVVPANTRISTQDGKSVFVTVEAVTVAAGVLSASVQAFSITPGKTDNGLAVGEVKVILDPLPFLLTAANTDVTAGGADEESDDQLRERIKLAPGTFSTAGSKEAYIYHTKTSSALIVDVAVTQPTPGSVQVWPMVAGGVSTPAPILAIVLAALSDEKVRPLTDTVIVTSPTVVEYEIDLQLVTLIGADNTAALANVTKLVTDYRDAKALKLGQDITPDQLIAAALINGVVYDVTVVEPTAPVIISPTQVGKCTALTITITGQNAG